MKRDLLILGIVMSVFLFLTSCENKNPKELCGIYKATFDNDATVVLGADGELKGGKGSFYDTENIGIWYVKEDTLFFETEKGGKNFGKYIFSDNKLVWERLGEQLIYVKIANKDELERMNKEQSQKESKELGNALEELKKLNNE